MEGSPLAGEAGPANAATANTNRPEAAPVGHSARERRTRQIIEAGTRGASFVFRHRAGNAAILVLILVAASRESANAGSAAPSVYAAPAALVMAARDSLGSVAVLAFGLGGLMYYSVFYRSRLVPRWLSAWGLVAVASVMVSILLVMFGRVEAFSAPQLVLALPIAVQEMVLAVWLIAKGFGPSPRPAVAVAKALAPA